MLYRLPQMQLVYILKNWNLQGIQRYYFCSKYRLLTRVRTHYLFFSYYNKNVIFSPENCHFSRENGSLLHRHVNVLIIKFHSFSFVCYVDS